MKVIVNGEIVTDEKLVAEKWKNDFSNLYNVNPDSFENSDNDFYDVAQNYVHSKEHDMTDDNYQEDVELNRTISHDEISNVLSN